MKKAFTLIELLIVIGIIAILAAVLLANMGGAIESAKLSKCQSNIKNLATAVHSFAMDEFCEMHGQASRVPPKQAGAYPDAFRTEAYMMESYKAWISLRDGGAISCLAAPRELDYAITNGAIWRYTGENRAIYQCPVHAACCRETLGIQPGWSYVMNRTFRGASVDSFDSPEHMLMLAEMPGLTKKLAKKLAGGNDILPPLMSDTKSATDAVLSFHSEKDPSSDGDDCGSPEPIGFNHRRGKDVVGVVVFADCHTEMIALPKRGDVQQLTNWLCDGYHVIHRNGTYSRVRDDQ